MKVAPSQELSTLNVRPAVSRMIDWCTGMTDSSNLEHNKKNRRVEVKVFPLEKE